MKKITTVLVVICFCLINIGLCEAANKHGPSLEKIFSELADLMGSDGEADKIRAVGIKMLAEEELTPKRLQEIQQEEKASNEEMYKAMVYYLMSYFML